MNIYKQIENYLNNKIKTNEEYIIKEVSNILGIDENYINDKLKHFFPIYTIRRNSLKLALDMDFDKIPINDIKLIDYLLEKMEDEDKIYIGGLSVNTKVAILLFKKTSRTSIMHYNNNDNVDFYFENDIYQGSKSSDLNYINSLLLFLGVSKKNNLFNFVTDDVTFENSNYIYVQLLTYLGIMITSNLHKKNIYLFDNKYLSQNSENLESSIEDYFQKFYTLFKDIINILITDYKKFIEFLGEDYFIEFARRIKNDELENIDDLINLMYKHYIEYTNGIVVDIETISNSIKKYKKDK